MAQIFTALLLTSGIGTALALILTLLKPITRKVFSGGWHYYMWLVVLLVMVLPIRLNLPEKPVTTPPTSETVTITDNQAENTETPIIDTQPEQIIQAQPTQPEKVSTIQAIKNFLITNLQLFSLIWLMGAVLLFLIKIVSYLVFLIKIHKHSEIISCPEVKAYTNRKIKTRVSDTICSPLMIGIIRPTLLLPKTDITPEQLHNVLAHEMIHLKRNDILYKWFVSIVKCVHWFNPAIYFISKQINIDCEISCDLAVVKEMDEQQEKGYVETILSLLTHNNSKAIPLTTGMTGNKETLKRRFTMIKKRKNIGKVTQILSTVLAVVILVTTVFTSGVLATEILKKDNSENIFDIEVRHNGYLVALTNKPFFENNVLYLPLRELLEKTGLVDNEDSYIKWDNGKITLCITEGDNAPNYDSTGNQIGTKPIIIQYYYGLEIGKAEYILNPEGTLPEQRHHLSLSKDMTNAPILKDSITYIPYEYVEYMVNKVMRNHEITIWDITNISTKNIDNIDNAEDMTYEDIRSLQISVDNGHFPWRLDPEQVIMAFLSGKGISVSNIRLPEITNDKLKYVDGNIEIELFKPIDKSEKGIWIVKTFQKKGNAIIQEVHFYERTPAQAWINKQEDGWYKVPQHISAVLQYEGDKPHSISAYFTPAGTNMESEKKLVGQKVLVTTDTSISQTPARFPSLDIDFSKEDTLGHLWFVFNFEDGSSIVSEIYNMYIE
ncbi:MAG: M56 family metallopeptidase [Clostridia bacterium]|nr:M56 family metallopeptidase [Clostridia bacterium]